MKNVVLLKGRCLTAKITIITVVLNQAVALRQTIQSVVAQSYSNLDYIVVDGGSVDETPSVIEEYGDSLAGWISEKDEGIYDAMNKGWAMADPESYVLFLGAGDCLLRLPDTLPAPGETSDVYYGNVNLDGNLHFFPSTGWKLKLYNSIHHQGMLVPKQLHISSPFDVKYRFYADFDFNQKLKKAGVRFLFVPELSTYASSGGATAVTDIREMTQIVKANYGVFWWFLSVSGFRLASYFAVAGRFKPIR